MFKSGILLITILISVPVAVERFAGSLPVSIMQAESYPWQSISKCSNVEVSITQSKLTSTDTFRKISVKTKNQNDFQVDATVTPRVRTNDGNEIALPAQTVRLNPGQDSILISDQWQIGFADGATGPGSSPKRVVAWGFDDLKIKKTTGNDPAESCSLTPVLTFAASIAATLQQLSTVNADGDNVPPIARDKLIELKEELEKVVVAAASNQTASVDPQSIRSVTSETLQLEGIAVGDSSGPVFGAIRSLDIRTPSNHPDWIAVTLVLSLPNSSDTSLHVLNRREGSWQSILSIDHRGYQKTGDALGELSYAFSPTIVGNTNFVVVANITPRGSTGPHVIHHQVYIPATDIASPVLVDEGTEVYCGGEGTSPTYSIFPDADGVVIRYSNGPPNPTIQAPLAKYAFESGQVRKVISLEQSARAFIDQWVGLPSVQQADSLIDSIAAEIVSCRRSSLQVANFRPSAQENTIRTCPADNCQFQMKVRKADVNNPNIFFTVVRRRDGFYVQHINNVAPVRCDRKAP